MDNINHCISCNVKGCKHHCSCEDYCSLGHIQVGAKECFPGDEECTDCRSFERK